MHVDYRPTGVCSVLISFDINDGVVTNLRFMGGCPGNLSAIAKLLNGQKAEYIIKKLKGNRCGNKPTSCADQLVKALEAHVND